MSAITIDDVKKLATLSALSINDEQAVTLTGELEKILEYVERLEEIDTDGVPPTFQVNDLSSVVREDVVIDYDVTQRELLQNAPHVRDSQIEVKKVL